MLEILKKPHPFIFNLYSVLIPSAISFLIIVLLAPFQFQEAEMSYRLISGSAISILVALGVFLAVKILQKLLPNTMSEDHWTVGKELTLVLFGLLVIICLIFIAFLLFQSNTVSILPLFLKTISITLAIGILPILFLILFEQYRHQKIQLKEATALTEHLKTRTEKLLVKQENKPKIGKVLLLKSENEDIELQLHPKDLIYLKSDGNYIEVYYKNSDKIQKKVIRNRLKIIEETLPKNLFFRCHNSYVVNGYSITKIEGNARNLSLHLKDDSAILPVSRSKAKALSIFLEQLQ